jgi:hypothetical protein
MPLCQSIGTAIRLIELVPSSELLCKVSAPTISFPFLQLSQELAPSPCDALA